MNLAVLGLAHRLLGEFGAAARCYGRAQARYREIGDRVGESDILRGLAEVHCDSGRPATALELARGSQRVAREFSHDTQLARVHPLLARIHFQRGDLAAVDVDSRRALDLAHRIGSRNLVAEALLCRALVHRSAGAPGRGRGCAQEALDITRKAGYRLHEGRALTASAAVALAAGDPDRALQDAQEALSVHQETGHRPGEARTRVVLAAARQLAGGAGAARSERAHATRLCAELGLPQVSEPDASGWLPW
jgi:tetratricopeptide (TPR) repeat protein